jgi:hypothetical protein
MTRDAELSHDEHVKRSIQRTGNFISDRHTPARQRENDHIRSALVVGEMGGQLDAGLATIGVRLVNRGAGHCLLAFPAFDDGPAANAAGDDFASGVPPG